VREHAVEWAGYPGEIESVDEQARVADLPAAAATHEAPKLILSGASLPCRLLLEGTERSEITLRLDHLLHGLRSQGADQLVLEVCDAHVEAESLHPDAGEVGAEARTLERTPKVTFLRRVAEAGEPNVGPLRAVRLEEVPDRLRTADRHDLDALVAEVATTPLGERFERCLVARPLDEHDRPSEAGLGPGRLGTLLASRHLGILPGATQHIESRHAIELVSSGGGFGYLLKDRVLDVDEFLEAAERVSNGGSALDPEVVKHLLAHPKTTISPG
jgi:hypothetical protein